MKNAASAPLAPGAIAEGLSRFFPLRLQCDAKAMEALGALVGCLYRAAGFEVGGE